MRPVIESRNVHHRGHVVRRHGVGGVHALRHGARGVFAVADILEPEGEFRAPVSVPLVGHFVAYAPHHDARVVAEPADEVHQIALGPLAELLVVAVFDLLRLPLVERFGHDHHARFVAYFDQLRSRHVVRGAYGVAAHLLQQPDPVPDRRLVHDAAQRSEVVVETDAPEFQRLAVQPESFALHGFDRADAEHGDVAVLQLAAFVDLRSRGVERRSVGRPERGAVDRELLLEAVVAEVGSGGLPVPCHDASGGVRHRRFDRIVGGRLSLRNGEGGALPDAGGRFVGPPRDDLRSPHRDVRLVRYDEVHVAVDSGAGIPARRFGEVFEPDGQQILPAGVQQGRDVRVEGVVAVGPADRLPAVHVHARMAHRAVEEERAPAAFVPFRHFEAEPVPARADEGQPSGPSGVFHGLCLAVLRDGRVLEIVSCAERTVDGPVVRYGHLLPPGGVVRRFGECRGVVACEAPSFFEQPFGAYLRLQPYREQQEHPYESFHRFVRYVGESFPPVPPDSGAPFRAVGASGLFRPLQYRRFPRKKQIRNFAEELPVP